MKELRKITKKELKTILAEHEKWVKSDGILGERANLMGIDLTKADLSNAHLRDANLTMANLEEADLRNADLEGSYLDTATLRDADIRGANLRFASIRSADFKGANLIGTDLRDSDLSYADFKGANLSKANLIRATLSNADLKTSNLRHADLSWSDLSNADLRGSTLNKADLRNAYLKGTDLSSTNFGDFICSVYSMCPEEGSFIAWKKAIEQAKNIPVIIKLLIPEDALRSSGTGRKCRASKAVVLDIQTLEGKSLKSATAYSSYNYGFIYEIGKTVESDGFDENRFNECSNGIHFFMDRWEAVEYCV